MDEPTSDVTVITFKLIFLCIFIALGIVGNCTVLISIAKYQKLQTIPNFFVFNLAVADLLFSVMGMPMILVTTICQKWVLGDFLCKLNGLLNSLFCTTSIWTLVMISVNRYVSVARPHDIKRIYTVRKTYMIIAGVWLFAFLVSMPPLVGWSEFVPGSNFCTVNGKSGLSYGVLFMFVDYFFPMLFLAGLYLRIFFLLKKNKAAMVKARNNSIMCSPDNTLDNSTLDCPTLDSESLTESGKSPTESQKQTKKLDRRILAMKRKNLRIALCRKSKEPSKGEEVSSLHHIKNNNTNKSGLKPPGGVSGMVNTITVHNNNTRTNANVRNVTTKVVRICSDRDDTAVRRTKSIKRRRHISTFKKFFAELDVTRMLLIVVLAFFLCWTTFVISSILYAFNIVPEEYRLLTFGIYIACLNSIINPLIYALMNRNFRHYFKELYRGTKKTCCCIPETGTK